MDLRKAFTAPTSATSGLASYNLESGARRLFPWPKKMPKIRLKPRLRRINLAEALLKDGPVDEPRDDKGQWTSGGGGGSLNLMGQTKNYSQRVLDNARVISPGIDHWIESGGKKIGGPYRRKSWAVEALSTARGKGKKLNLENSLRKDGPVDEPRDSSGQWTSGGGGGKQKTFEGTYSARTASGKKVTMTFRVKAADHYAAGDKAKAKAERKYGKDLYHPIIQYKGGKSTLSSHSISQHVSAHAGPEEKVDLEEALLKDGPVDEPRDDKGQWTSGGGSSAKANATVVYHGTVASVVDKVASQGLKPGGDQRVWSSSDTKYYTQGERGKSSFVTSNLLLANSYAHDAKEQLGKGTPVIFRIEVPASEAKSFKRDSLEEKSFYRPGGIPAAWITNYSVSTSRGQKEFRMQKMPKVKKQKNEVYYAYILVAPKQQKMDLNAALRKVRRPTQEQVKTKFLRMLSREVPPFSHTILQLLRKKKDAVKNKLLAWYAGQQKLAKISEPDMRDILDALELGDWYTAREILRTRILRQYQDSGRAGLQAVTADVTEAALALVNERAVAYAESRAAELVTEIGETTRDYLRDLITEAVDEGMSAKELSEGIEDSLVFSEGRSDMIARTELSFAHNLGNMDGWKASGQVEYKQSLIGSEHDKDDECDENADAGAIPMDDEFPSGDDSPPYHPNCVCVLVPVFADEVEG